MKGLLIGAYLLAGCGMAGLLYRGDVAGRQVQAPYVYAVTGLIWPICALSVIGLTLSGNYALKNVTEPK